MSDVNIKVCTQGSCVNKEVHMTLITRLESAPCGSRELSDEVLEVFGWRFAYGSSSLEWVRDPQGNERNGLPSPTQRVDVALALVPDDAYLRYMRERPTPGEWQVALDSRTHDVDPLFSGIAATPALALCAALLRMKENEA